MSLGEIYYKEYHPLMTDAEGSTARRWLYEKEEEERLAVWVRIRITVSTILGVPIHSNQKISISQLVSSKQTTFSGEVIFDTGSLDGEMNRSFHDAWRIDPLE